LEGRRPVITSAIEEIEPNKVVLGNNDHHTISTGGAGEALGGDACSAPATTSDRVEGLIVPDSSFIACLPASASVEPAAATSAAAKEKYRIEGPARRLASQTKPIIEITSAKAALRLRAISVRRTRTGSVGPARSVAGSSISDPNAGICARVAATPASAPGDGIPASI
jgi:hypothetical protein